MVALGQKKKQPSYDQNAASAKLFAASEEALQKISAAEAVKIKALLLKLN